VQKGLKLRCFAVFLHLSIGKANVINKAAPVFLTEFHLGDGFKSLHKKAEVELPVFFIGNFLFLSFFTFLVCSFYDYSFGKIQSIS